MLPFRVGRVPVGADASVSNPQSRTPSLTQRTLQPSSTARVATASTSRTPARVAAGRELHRDSDFNLKLFTPSRVAPLALWQAVRGCFNG